MHDYDLIVIGAGPGGYTAALRAAKLGKRTAVIESGQAGGTCLNRGCVPTKALLHASETYRAARNGEKEGLFAEDIRLSIPELYARKDQIVSTLSKGIETLLKGAGIRLIRGTARIMGPHLVRVRTDGQEQNDYTADAILAATGAVPAAPPIEGLDLPGVLTSDSLLRGMDRPYGSVVIIGGGVIGIEFATFFADIGTKVTVLEGLDRLLPSMDRELGQNLALLLKNRGVRTVTGAMVQRVEQTETGLKVCFDQKGVPGEAEGETVLSAIGRRPYWDDLFAKGLEPQSDGKRIRVDDSFRTSIPGIYAIGDVSSAVQLAHVAAAQGTVFAERLCGAEPSLDLTLIPACIYCRPEIASVGLTEADAKAAGLEIKIGRCVLGANARTLIAEPGRSFMKLIAEVESGALIGAVLMCPNATDMISEFSVAIANRLTPRQMLRTMRPHPTFEESAADALQDLCAKLGI